MRYRPALLLFILLLTAGTVFAQSGYFTVQTVAFPDYRMAQDVISDLRSHGFDAYSEFTMFEGTQYARVRIGCFSSEAAAAVMADLLLSGYADEAVVQPFSPGAGATFCLRDDIGFIKPAEWSIQERDRVQIVFRVQLAGATGFVRMFNGEWRLLTEIEPDVPPPATGSVPFRQEGRAGQPFVLAQVAGADRIICPGELVWQSGFTAVVERASVVAACVVEPMAAGRGG